MILNNYLKYLQESKIITQNSNAPCAAYETVYGKPCPKRPGMNPSHKQREWDGIFVDEHLEDKWLNDLKNIKEIEMRSSCEGHDKEWVAFIIFRARKNIDFDKVTKSLEASDNLTKSAAHIGRGGQLRCVVAAPVWYGHKDWKKWWSTLANRIKLAIK